MLLEIWPFGRRYVGGELPFADLRREACNLVMYLDESMVEMLDVCVSMKTNQTKEKKNTARAEMPRRVRVYCADASQSVR